MAQGVSIFTLILDIGPADKYNLMTDLPETEKNMKNKLKRILPILFVILVICSLIWYLFVYDRDFTRDMLLQQARFFENNGKHKIAAWLYNQAYRQSENNESVAIELAEQYKAIGNYTKAEFTLSSAIADGGSVELYVALCKTYVEQDKLLDAVTMLGSIEDPVIKEQLEAMRPAAPTVSPAPGFYSQYLTVTVEASGGTLYVTSDGEYPTTSGTPNNGAVTLVGGENKLLALSVGENGLVSPLSVFGFTVGGVIEELKMTDSTMEEAVRKILGKDAAATLFTNDLWSITSFVVPEGAMSLDDLAYMPYLQSLTIENNLSDDYHSIASLTQLTELIVRNCILSTENLMAVVSAPNLEKLTLSNCGLANVEALANATHLTYLDLSGNTVKNLSAIGSLSQLQALNLSHNALTNVSDLSALANLAILDVSHNQITTALPLSGCEALTWLNIGSNLLTDLSGVESLSKLISLQAAYNQLDDISAIADCGSLMELDISNNQLSNISQLSSLPNLQALNFSRNQVTTLPPFDTKSVLVYIDGSYNQLITISGLAGLPMLNNVVMNYNNISAVNALASCPNLIQVDVYGNPVSDVSALEKQSIIVNYTPK